MRFIDLDGTLLDLWPRYHKVFCTLLQAEDISLEQYKIRKQQYGKDEIVARSFGYELPADFFFRKAYLLEAKEYLALDHWLLTTEEIKSLFESGETILLTKRRFPKHLKWQLDQWDLNIPTVVVGNTKLQWLQNHYSCSEKIIIVGDSLMDLEAGKLDNVFPAMVGYGLGTKEQFDNLGVPYKYMETVEEMHEYLTCYK